jgi:coronin-7
VFQSPNDINGIACNAKFFAYIDTTGTGSSLAVLPLTSTGKNHVPISSPAYMQPIIRAHSQSIQDFDFDPFNQYKIYSCSSDKTIKLWDLPQEGLVVDLNVSSVTLSLADGSPVKSLACHPCASGVLAARSAKGFTLFDVSSSNVIASTPAVGNPATTQTADIMSCAWSFQGDLLVTTSKDKQMRLFDVRALSSGATSSTAVSAVSGHAGLRFSRTVWLGDSPYLLSCGHNNAQEREIMLWDSRCLGRRESASAAAAVPGDANTMAVAVKRERVDSSYGSLLPLFDADHGTLMLLGKGDSSLRLYDIDTAEGAIYPISNNSIGAGGAGDVTKGACVLPRQANDVMSCEVYRVLRLSESAVQPVSITVPRKEKLKFHEDLFPPTYSLAEPSMTAVEWAAGSNAALVKVPMAAPGASAGGGAHSGASSPVPAGRNSASPVPASSSAAAAGTEGGSEGDEDGENTPTPSSRASMLSKRFSSLNAGSKFRHMYGTESVKESSFFNLQPDLSAMDSPIVACSDTYFAIPHRAGGSFVRFNLF